MVTASRTSQIFPVTCKSNRDNYSCGDACPSYGRPFFLNIRPFVLRKRQAVRHSQRKCHTDQSRYTSAHSGTLIGRLHIRSRPIRAPLNIDRSSTSTLNRWQHSHCQPLHVSMKHPKYSHTRVHFPEPTRVKRGVWGSCPPR